MPAVRAVDLVVVAASAIVATALVATSGGGWAEMLFGTVSVACLAFVVRTVARDQRRARSQARRVRELMAAQPGELAAEAVRDERARLSMDIAALLKEDLHFIEATTSADGAASDRTEVSRRIHDRCQRASSELRRQLGLIRTSDTMTDVVASAPEDEARIDRSDVLVGIATAALAAGEAVLYTYTEGRDWSLLSVVLTAVAGGAVIGRRTVPGPAACVIGLAYVAGGVFTAPVIGGFWCLISVGGVLWTVAARQRSRLMDAGGATFMVLAMTATVLRTDRANAAALLVVMAVATLGGLTARALRLRTARSDQIARDRAAELEETTLAAVTAEREQFAREIHDVVSHAVGVIAVQAAAAEVTWPDQPEKSDEAMATIAEAARTARLEIDALGLVPPNDARPDADLPSLVGRIRAAGVAVVLRAPGELPPELAGTAYRIVQEALTNVLRHGAGATAQVTIERAASELRIVITDDGPGVDQRRADRGFGLIGLGERVAYAGGTLATGPGEGGRGFRVEAILPVPAAVVS